MSHKASSWLADIPASAINAGAFRVLFHLCDAHNSKRAPETACFPSQEVLRGVTGLSNGGLNNALNSIEKAGLMRRRRTRGADGTKGPTFYILGCDREIEPSPTPESGDGTNSKLEAEPSPLSGMNHLHSTGDKPVIEPVKEPVSARERSDDLFNDLPDQSETDQLELLINEAWEEFQDIWPKGHPRRLMGKQGFEKFDAACRGKIAKASGAIAPNALNRAARAYIASVRDPQFIKGTVAWLNAAMWEPFMADAQEFNIEDLTARQRAMLEDGRVPPSMLEDGQPNAAAQFWLKKFGFGRAA